MLVKKIVGAPIVCLKNLNASLILWSQELYSKVNNRYRELNCGVIERQRKLAKISEELESIKKEMEERGTVMSDRSEFHR